MKQFFRDRSYDAVKLLVTQIAISILGFVLTLACGTAQNDVLTIACSVFAVGFYLFLVYTAIWDLGAKDAVSVEYGHTAFRPLTGLWISLLAITPQLLLLIGMTLGHLFPDVATLGSIGAVCQTMTLMFTQGMYSGLLMLEVGGARLNTYLLPFLLLPLLTVACSTLAYYFGIKNRRFTRLFELKNGKKDQPRNKR